MNYKCLFLDRDGVINYDYGHVGTLERFKFRPYIFELVQKANDLNYLVIVITNQSGIGRGFYSEKDFHKLNIWMIKKFEINNCIINDVFYCPYHPHKGIGKYRKESFDRKPSPGMINKALEKYSININSSILVGDKPSDIEAGKLAGIKNLYLINDSSSCTGAIKISHLNEIKL